MGDLQSADLLTLAAGLSRTAFDKASHALGWPDTANAGRHRGRIRWRNPYRNGWSGSALDADWLTLERRGLATGRADDLSRYHYWSVTDLGRAVVALRLRALLEVRRGR